VLLLGFWCAAAGALLGGRLLPPGATPRGVGLLVMAMLVALGLLRAALGLRAAWNNGAAADVRG
jgi:hypothetical protein